MNISVRSAVSIVGSGPLIKSQGPVQYSKAGTNDNHSSVYFRKYVYKVMEKLLVHELNLYFIYLLFIS